jgi:thiamine transport system substrate-binding protein
MASAAVAAALLAACGTSSTHAGSPGVTTVATTTSALATGTSSSVTATGVTITLLAYDAFVAPDALKDFTARTGIRVNVATGGDAGTLVNKAILTKGHPEGDVLWGLDNTLLSRAVDTAGLFVPYAPADLGTLEPSAVALVPGHQITPVDTGDVCINDDLAWFATHHLAPPSSLDDLVKPAYKGLLVTENPATSSTGLAFLLASVAHFGTQGYLSWWRQLAANGLLVVDSWDSAYNNEFSQGGSSGKRPLVVSYASSPPATIIYASDPKPTTPTIGNLYSTCFRQVEFAGILAGSTHVAAAQALIEFLIGAEFQAQLPLSNYVYPIRAGVGLPDLFTRFGQPAPHPFVVSPADIAAHRDDWIAAWTNAVVH